VGIDEKPYSCGGSIIVPLYCVRYVKPGRYHFNLLYHDYVIENEDRYVVNVRGKDVIPLQITLNCDSMDVSGFCSGHVISERQFIKRFCNGRKPKEYTAKV